MVKNFFWHPGEMKPKIKKKKSTVKKFAEKKIRVYIYKIIFIYYYYYFFFLSNHGLISSAPVISYLITAVLFSFATVVCLCFPLKSMTYLSSLKSIA